MATCSKDPYRIHDLSGLREVIGDPLALVEQKVDPALGEIESDYVRRSPFVLLSTADGQGHQDVSPKGDGPGFVLIEDPTTLVIPDRPGNKLVYGLTNILENPEVGVIFLTPGTPETLRVNGRAELSTDPALLQKLAARGKPAVVAIRVHVREVFFHCAKAFLRSELWKPDTWPERVKISFGRQFARKLGTDNATAAQIDKAIEEDYRTNL